MGRGTRERETSADDVAPRQREYRALSSAVGAGSTVERSCHPEPPKGSSGTQIRVIRITVNRLGSERLLANASRYTAFEVYLNESDPGPTCLNRPVEVLRFRIPVPEPSGLTTSAR